MISRTIIHSFTSLSFFLYCHSFCLFVCLFVFISFLLPLKKGASDCYLNILTTTTTNNNNNNNNNNVAVYCLNLSRLNPAKLNRSLFCIMMQLISYYIYFVVINKCFLYDYTFLRFSVFIFRCEVFQVNSRKKCWYE